MESKKFHYEITALAEMSFSDFDMLFEAAANHYDWRVKESTTQGFFMFGKRNRRNWAFEDDDLATSFEDFWTSSELNLMTKALEMTHTPEAYKLFSGMMKVFNSIQEEYKKSNQCQK